MCSGISRATPHETEWICFLGAHCPKSSQKQSTGAARSGEQEKTEKLYVERATMRDPKEGDGRGNCCTACGEQKGQEAF